MYRSADFRSADFRIFPNLGRVNKGEGYVDHNYRLVSQKTFLGSRFRRFMYFWHFSAIFVVWPFFGSVVYRGRSDEHDVLMLTSLALFLVMIWRGGGNLGCVIGQI